MSSSSVRRHRVRPRIVSVAVAVFASAVVMAGCASGAGSATTGDASSDRLDTVTIGVPGTLSYALPALLAPLLPEFEEEGIDVEVETVKSSEATLLLATSRIDAFVGSISAAQFNAVADGSRIAYVAPGGVNPEARWWVSTAALGDDDFSLASFEGRNVFTSTGTGSFVFVSLSELLRPAGLTVNDVAPTQLAPTDVVAALKNGSLFGATLDPTAEAVVEEDDIAFPVGTAVYPEGMSLAPLAFGPTLLDESPEVGQRFVDAWYAMFENHLQGDFYRDDEMAPLVREALDLTDDQLAALTPSEFSLDFTIPDFAASAEDVWRSLDALTYEGSIADQIVYREFMDHARESGGGD